MIQSLKQFLYEPKSKIGWVHGFITIVGSIILGYLTMMIYSKYIPADFGIKIIPSMLLTPILIACFSIWLLFSRTIIKAIEKFLFLLLFLIIILKAF